MEKLLILLGQNLDLNSAFSFVIVFLSGVVVSFTPCLYPLIPVTVGFIGAKSSGSKLRGFLLSVFYVFGISITYSLLGAIAGITGRAFGSLTNTPMVYFFAGNVFLLLGISMLGVFEIRLPQVLWRPKGGGVIPALLLGLASGLVIGPCIAPVLGALLLFVSTTQNVPYAMILLFVFAFGMGTLLILVGTFTSLLTTIPKSGKWMERIKKACGLILILAAEYFFIKMGVL